MKKETIKAYPFVVDAKKKNIRKDIEKDPVSFVKKMFTGSKYNFGVAEVTFYGKYKEQGYLYDLRPFLKRYVYKQYDMWNEIWAIDKTSARKFVGGKIDIILEIQ